MRKEWHRWLLLCSAGLLISTSFLGSLGTTIWGILYYQNPWLESNFRPTFNNCVVIWLLCSACTDTIITITYIVQLRSRLAGFNPSTDSALKIIINTTIQSAAYTTVIAVPGAILSLVYNGSDLMTCDIAYAFFLPLPACYALSLFTTLSVPDKLQSHRSSGVIGSYPQTTHVPTRISLHGGGGAESTLGAELGGCPYDGSEDRRQSMASVAFDSHANTKTSYPSSKRAYRSRSITSLRSLPSFPRPTSTSPLPLGSLSAIEGIQVHVQLHVEEDRIEDDEFERFDKGRKEVLLGTRLEVEAGKAGPGVRVQKGVVASGGSRGIRR
ncbi:hypothetical protein BCR35DRAFT_313276 [Leucosporidium creatinivorum]|uniref:Uncharacterized protein n=1 Tax=Leucosporidium creatinivorum TaxID=106004 RepID=A0A1Y2FRU2_9BASI|nr:hypothetical protein BCR35DRAFT_313276 [Leucosporidium creatinivorum]